MEPVRPADWRTMGALSRPDWIFALPSCALPSLLSHVIRTQTTVLYLITSLPLTEAVSISDSFCCLSPACHCQRHLNLDLPIILRCSPQSTSSRRAHQATRLQLKQCKWGHPKSLFDSQGRLKREYGVRYRQLGGMVCECRRVLSHFMK